MLRRLLFPPAGSHRNRPRKTTIATPDVCPRNVTSMGGKRGSRQGGFAPRNLSRPSPRLGRFPLHSGDAGGAAPCQSDSSHDDRPAWGRGTAVPLNAASSPRFAARRPSTRLGPGATNAHLGRCAGCGLWAAPSGPLGRPALRRSVPTSRLPLLSDGSSRGKRPDTRGAPERLGHCRALCVVTSSSRGELASPSPRAHYLPLLGSTVHLLTLYESRGPDSLRSS